MPIERRYLDPKTIELYNTDRDRPLMQSFMQAQMTNQTPDQLFQQMTGASASDAERNRDDQYDVSPPGMPWEGVSPKQRREMRKQLRRFDQYAREGGTDLVSGFQELVESGAVVVDENGDVYTAMPGRAQNGEDVRLLNAARAWSQYQDELEQMRQQVGQHPLVQGGR